MIDYILNTYGFLLPKGKTMNSKDFANLIKDNYDLQNIRNKEVYDFVLSSDLEFKRNWF